MNTYTNVMHPKKKVDQTTRIKAVTMIVVVLALITVAAYVTHRLPAVAGSNPSVPFRKAK